MKRKKWNAKRLSAIILSLALILPGNIVFAEEADIVLPEGITVQQEIPEIDEIDGFVDFSEEEPAEEVDESTPVDGTEIPEVTEPGDETESPEATESGDEPVTSEVTEPADEAETPESDPSDSEAETPKTDVPTDEENDSEAAVSDNGADVNEETGSDEVLTYYATSDGWEWNYSGGYAYISGYSGTSTTLKIPESLALNGKTYPVTEIRSSAFWGNKTITSVTIPKSVTTIGNYAFEKCVSLTTVTLNEGLTTIGQSAFEGCSSLKSIVVPSTVTSMGRYVFADCSLLGKVTLSNRCTEIDFYAFKNCVSLTEINIPSCVLEIGKEAFYGCIRLKKITLNEGLSVIGSNAFAQCTALEGIMIPSTVNTIDTGVFLGCTALKTANIKSKIIGTNMFQQCSKLQEVALADNLLTIGQYAFESCTSLRSVELPVSLMTIGSHAFSNCDSLVSVTVPDFVTSVGDYAFSECDMLETANIDSSIVGFGMFYNCPKLRKVMLGDGVTTIDGYAFENDSSLAIIYIPASVKSISFSAFTNSGLSSGTVFCEKGSYAAGYSAYPYGTTIRYGQPFIAPPKFTVKGVIGGRTVTFKSDTDGAVIYYSTKTSNLTTSDKSIKNGGTVTFENFYGTVYARAYYKGEWSNVARLVLKIPTVNTPTITQSGSKVTIKTTTPLCTIYYTTDGSTPSPTNGKKIEASSGSFNFTGGTVKAIAVRSCFTNSEVAQKKISSSVSSSVGVPSFKVVGQFNGRQVTFTSSTPGAMIYYSTSSAISTNDSGVQSGKSVTFNNFYGTIYARAYANGKWSNVSRLILKIPVVNKPTITYSSGGYVNIKTTTPGCRIIYTTNGTTPTLMNGTMVYGSSARVYVGTGKTVKAIAVRSCFTNSDVATYKR